MENIQSQIYEEAVDINIAKNPEDNKGDNITYLEKKIDQPITPVDQLLQKPICFVLIYLDYGRSLLIE